MLTFAKSNDIKSLNKKGLLTLRQLFLVLFFTVFGNSFLCSTNNLQDAYATSTAVYSNLIDPSRAVSKWRTSDGALAVSSASTGDGAALYAANAAAASNTPAANAAANSPAVANAAAAGSAASTSVPVNSFGGKKGYVASSNNGLPESGSSSGEGSNAARSADDANASNNSNSSNASGAASENKSSDGQNFGIGTGGGNGSVSNSDSNGAKVSESEAAEDYYCEYKTKPNDDIVSISKYFHTTINEFMNSIANHNEIDFGKGMRILVPIKHYTMQEGETIDSVAKKMNLDPKSFAEFNQEYDSVKTDNVIMLPMLDTTRKIVVHPLNGANSNIAPTENKTEEKAPTSEAVVPVVVPVASADALSKDIIHQQSIPDDLPVPTPKPSDYPHINNKDFDSFGNATNTTASVAAIPVPAPVSASVPAPVATEKKDKDAKKNADAEVATAKPAKEAISVKAAEEPKSKHMLIWPAKGKLVSKFKEKSGDHGEGITIKANQGTDIKAAANGTVFYSGDGITSYGNLIILKHENGFMTLYGHNADRIVKKGDVVKSGQVIAHVGKTGSVKTPQLFFALRHNKKPVDPLKYMPPVSENK